MSIYRNWVVRETIRTFVSSAGILATVWFPKSSKRCLKVGSHHVCKIKSVSSPCKWEPWGKDTSWTADEKYFLFSEEEVFVFWLKLTSILLSANDKICTIGPCWSQLNFGVWSNFFISGSSITRQPIHTSGHKVNNGVYCSDRPELHNNNNNNKNNPPTSSPYGRIMGQLTHLGRDKMDAISQTTFSTVSSWMKMFEFRLIFDWSLFPRV